MKNFLKSIQIAAPAISKFDPRSNRRARVLFFGAAAMIMAFAASPARALLDSEYGEGFIAAAQGILVAIQNTVYWVIAGAVSLTLSSNILQWLVNNQTQLISFNGDFIKNGLGITQGLANMLLILAFVLASFGIIFKQREFEAKRAVVTIVLTAIATHFGVMLVKIMVDIGNVAINTIVGTNTSLIVDKTTPLIKDALVSSGAGLVGMGSLAGLLAIPYLNIATIAATAISIGSVGAAFVGYNNVISDVTTYAVVNFLVKWVFLIIACHVLSGVYITFILLYLSRIFMLSILTVLSPLAIMSYALPYTRNHFRKWWDSLLKWTFVGVWTLFFLMLGLGSDGFITPSAASGIDTTFTGGSSGILSQVVVDSGMLYYLFLICYLALVQNMAENSGVGSLFKAALIGAGGALVANTVKPTMTAGRKGLEKSYMAAQNRIEGKRELDANYQPSFSEKLALHGSGFLANAINEKQLSNWGGLLSGNEKKAAGAAENLSKTFDLAHPKSFSNIDPMIDSRIAEIGKTSSVEKIIGKAGKVDMAEAIWAMKNAKSEDLPALMNSFGPNANRFLNYAIKENKLSPSALQNIARNTKALDTEGHSELRDYLVNQDRPRTGERYGEMMKKVRAFSGIAPDADFSPEEKANADKMLARVMNLKGATNNKDTFKKLSGDIFANDENLKAMLMTARSNMFGFAGGDDVLRNKLFGATKANFDQLAKSNPDLIKDIAAKSVIYKDAIPQDIIDGANARPEAERADYMRDAILARVTQANQPANA